MLSQASGPALDPPTKLSPFRSKPAPLVGARRMFPAHFKLQVLDAYRYDNECKGNQRATARKFNVHRRQIQKWLQCENNLRASVADALQYTADASKLSLNKIPSSSETRLPEPTTRVFKHDARTLKLVAQKLYPSSSSGAIYKDDQQKGDLKKLRVSPCFVPNENQLNDLRSEAMSRPLHVDNSVYKFNMKNSSGLIIKDRVTPTRSPPMIPMLPLPPLAAHRPIYPPVSLPYSDEPYNLVKSVPTTPPTVPRPPTPQPMGAVATSTSPLPARVAEIVADSKTSAFSPKRKWLNECLQDRNNENSPPQASMMEPKQKKPCPDFSIERLCGFNEKKKEDNIVAPVHYSYPSNFPPPLVLQNRSIPELASLHFKPDVCEPVVVKEENISDDEQIDVTSTTPLEEKSFDFPDCSAKRRSYTVQFKLNVLDAFHHDKDCNQNQRATARKFNIHRRQVQKWVNAENALRGVGCHKCPFHCTDNLQCICLQELPPQLSSNWSSPGSFQMPLVPWYLPYSANGVY